MTPTPSQAADLLAAAEYLEGDGVSMPSVEAERIAGTLRGMAPPPVAQPRRWTDAELLALQPRVAPGMDPQEFLVVCRGALDACAKEVDHG